MTKDLSHLSSFKTLNSSLEILSLEGLGGVGTQLATALGSSVALGLSYWHTSSRAVIYSPLGE